MTNTFLSIGSNLNNPLKQVNLAIDTITKLPHTKIINKSKFYRTAPYGTIKQPDYLNAVIQLNTKLDIETFFEYTKKIEKQYNKFDKKVRWGPRIIDLDILIFGQLVINTQRLTLPHYDMYNRAFVLIPLMDIDPKLILPNNKKITDMIKLVDCSKIYNWIT